jgi:hypothetical protein
MKMLVFYSFDVVFLPPLSCDLLAMRIKWTDLDADLNT